MNRIHNNLLWVHFIVIILFFDPASLTNLAHIQKCCSESKILFVDNCRFVNETKVKEWTPVFMDGNTKRDYNLTIGLPKCGSRQLWPIYHNDQNINDKLTLLPDGSLRHFVITDESQSYEDFNDLKNYFDYELGSYCIDKRLEIDSNMESSFAMVCIPVFKSAWEETDFIIRKVVDPLLHILAIVCYASVAVIHFVLPQLKDLVGNIITSTAICLVIGQSADLIRIFAHYNTYLDYFITDVVMLVSLLGSYFWISLLGFYIWKTFRSRNVFLRITDGRKYCYYSVFVWSCTIFLAVLAVFAHFMLDTPESFKHVNSYSYHPDAEKIGWLGMSIFFAPIAFSILMDIYFYVTTRQVLKRMNTYGRIHHKLMYSFDTFIKMFIIMTVAWIFFILSWLPFHGTYYCYVLSNGLEGPIILYISVLRQRKIRVSLMKNCCYEKCICPCFRPDPVNDIPEWGEEMMSMNF